MTVARQNFDIRTGYYGSEKRNREYKCFQTVVGGFLIHLVLGTLYCWANITSAVTSRLRIYHPNTTYNDTVLVYAAALAGLALTMIIGGILSQRVGPQACCCVGSLILVTGTYLSSLTTTVLGLIIAQGIFLGVGMGLCYTPPIAAAVRWLPAQKGLVTGIIVGGFGLGAFVFGIIANCIVNPDHESVMMSGPDKGYFPASSAVVASVPTMFQVLALTYTGVLIIGCSLICNPQDELYSTSYQSLDKDDDTKNENCFVVADLSPWQLISLPLMWHLASCLISTTVGGMYIAGTFKVFAQSRFSDESFLSTITAASSIFNSFGRICWGRIADVIGPLNTLIYMSLFFAFLMAIFPACALYGKTSFAICSFLVFFFEGANFVLYMPMTVQLFGSKHSGGNYALIFTSYALFSVMNILLLAKSNVSFETASQLMAILTFMGFLNLILLRWHINSYRSQTSCIKY